MQLLRFAELRLRGVVDGLSIWFDYTFRQWAIKRLEVSFMTNELPSVWLCADVVPVFKKGSSSDVKNYRPISLTCIACKVMERMSGMKC